MIKRAFIITVMAFISTPVLHASPTAGIEARQQQILEVYFKTFGDLWIHPAAATIPTESGKREVQKAIRAFFPTLTQSLPTTPDGWRRFAATDKRLMLGAYYAAIGPEAAPDSSLLRPLADIVVGPGGNAKTLDEALEKAEDGQVVALLPGTHMGHVVLNRDLILIGLGRSSEVIIQGTAKSPVSVDGGNVLLVGMTFRFQSQQAAKMFALDIRGGMVTAVACRAENDSLSGFVSREQASSRFLRCIAENNKQAGFLSLGRSRLEAFHCRVSNSGLNGFAAQDEARMALSHCIADNNKYSGFASLHRSSLEASHCRSRGNGLNGFAAQDDARMALSYCIAENNKGTGFVSLQRSSFEASHCRSGDNGLSGFAAQDDARMALSHCIAENNKQAGFVSFRRSGLEASHCRSLFNGTNALWEDGTVPIRVSFFESRGNRGSNTIKNRRQEHLDRSPTILIREH